MTNCGEMGNHRDESAVQEAKDFLRVLTRPRIANEDDEAAVRLLGELLQLRLRDEAYQLAGLLTIDQVGAVFDRLLSESVVFSKTPAALKAIVAGAVCWHGLRCDSFELELMACPMDYYLQGQMDAVTRIGDLVHALTQLRPDVFDV